MKDSPVVEFQRLARTAGSLYVQIDDDFGPISGHAYRTMLLAGQIDPILARSVRDNVRVRVPTRSRCEAVYGTIQTESCPDGWCRLLNTEWLNNLRTVEVPSILRQNTPIHARVHKKAAGALHGVLADAALYLQQHPEEKWRIYSLVGWPGRPRHIGRDPKRNLSRHSWACAFDVNPPDQDKIPGWFFDICRAWGWTCGADWSKERDEYDPMHAELLRR